MMKEMRMDDLKMIIGGVKSEQVLRKANFRDPRSSVQTIEESARRLSEGRHMLPDMTTEFDPQVRNGGRTDSLKLSFDFHTHTKKCIPRSYTHHTHKK